jgi:hypothetical protein
VPLCPERLCNNDDETLLMDPLSKKLNQQTGSTSILGFITFMTLYPLEKLEVLKTQPIALFVPNKFCFIIMSLYWHDQDSISHISATLVNKKKPYFLCLATCTRMFIFRKVLILVLIFFIRSQNLSFNNTVKTQWFENVQFKRLECS